MKKAMLFFVLIILVRFAYSANVKLKIQQWQPNKGLPETPVLSIDQDEEGFIIDFPDAGFL